MHLGRGTSLWGLLAIALTGCCLLASPAAAAQFVVDTTEDLPGEGCGFDEECTLRQAIETANETQAADVIEFDLSGAGSPPYTIGLQSALPEIESGQLAIDGTSVLDYEGTPLIFVDGSEVPQAGDLTGFEISTDGSSVEGLAIGNFLYGIYVNGATDVSVCGNYIGTDTTGTRAEPNAYYGVELGPSSDKAAIGAGCPEQNGNLISGNGIAGVIDYGGETQVSANLIGIDALGAPLPNGGGAGISEPSGGVVLAAPVDSPNSERPVVGAHAGDPGNVIAFNDGPGVLVENGPVIQAAILGNSIFENTGLGIEVEGEQPPVPALESVAGDPQESSVTGTLHGRPNEGYELQFFDNDACDPSGSGEGRSLIGSKTVTADGAGNVTYSLGGLAPVAGTSDVVTATATDAATGTTSEFSVCHAFGGPAPGPNGPGTTPPATHSGPTPENGDSVVVETASGTILIKQPGEKKFHVLKEGEEIPVGSIVDATNGKVTLTSVDANGKTQTAVFYGGAFEVLQRGGSGLVVLKLRGGSFACGGAKAGSSATASKKSGRKLWGSGKGNFRSEGKHGSATVRGTKWLTEDRCDGTFFKVARGVVTVRDFENNLTKKLSPGQSYFTGG